MKPIFQKKGLLLLVSLIISYAGFLNAQVSPILPKSNSVIGDSNIFFQWNPVENVVSYDLEIGKDSPISTLHVQVQNLLITNLNIDTLSFNQKYFWRIRAHLSGGPQPWSQTWSFTHFKPDDLNNLSLWLLSDSTVLSGNKVISWPNNINAGISFNQSNSNRQPIYTSNTPELNNHSIISFDGINDFLDAGDTLDLNGSDRSLFIVGKVNTTNVHAYFSKTKSGTATNKYLIFNRNSELRFLYEDQNQFRIYEPSSFGNYEIVSALTDRVTTQNHLYRNSVFLNSIGNIANASYNFNSDYHCLVGATTDNNNTEQTNFLNGDITEVLLYDEALSDSLRTLVEMYFRYKFAPAVNLGEDINLDYGFCDVVLNAGKPWFQTYNWNTGAGFPSITANQSGNYNVTATDIFGFESVDSINVSLTAVNTISDTTICLGDTVYWNTQLDPAYYTFSWSNASTSANIPISDPGNYSVTITDTNGCQYISDTVEVLVDTYRNLVSLGADTVLCSGNFIGLSIGGPQTISYLWRGGSTNSSLAIDTTGLYWVRIENAIGCIGRDTISVQIKGQAPIVDFMADTVCFGEIMSFTDLSNTLPPDGIASRYWDFGDGDTSIVANPMHLYISDGIFNVTLTAVTDSGCSGQISKNVLVNSETIPYFISKPGSSGCILIPITFEDSSIIGLGDSIIQWAWDFGDTNMGNGSSVQHSYSQPGNYIVTLTVSTVNNCQYDTTLTISIVGSVNLPRAFDLVSPTDGYYTENPIISLEWNITNNQIYYQLEVAQDINFNSIVLDTSIAGNVYNWTDLTQFGTYYWRVTAFNQCLNQTGSGTWKFSYFSPLNLPGIQLWLQADSVDLNGSSVSKWRNLIDLGTSFTQSNINRQPAFINQVQKLNNHAGISFDGLNDFMEAGDTFDLGFKSRSLFVLGKSNNDNYNTYFSKTYTGIPNEPNRYILFNKSSELRLYYEDISDWKVYEPSSYGEYEIASALTDRDSLENRLYKNSIFLNSAGKLEGTFYNFNSSSRALLGATNGATNSSQINFLNGDISELILCENSLSDSLRNSVEQYLRFKYTPPVNLGADINIEYGICDTIVTAYKPWFISYIWNTGHTTPFITITKRGVYSVTVTDIFGYTSSDSIQYFHPYRQPFGDTTICIGDTITWHTNLEQSSYIFQWSNGSSGNSIDISDAGDYFVIITDTNGCQFFSDTINVIVDHYSMNMTLGPDTLFCAGGTIGLLVGHNQTANYLWKGGSTDSFLTIINTGIYWVETNNSTGCVGMDTVSVTINGVKPIVDFLADTVCEGSFTNFTDQSSTVLPDDVNGWKWYFGDGDSSSAQDPAHIYPIGGNYSVKLIAITDSGCISDIVKTVLVNDPSTPDFIWGPGSIGCLNVPLTFSDLSLIPPGDNIISWNWDFGDFNSGNGPFTSHQYSQTGNYLVTLSIETVKGCIYNTSKTVTIVANAPLPMPYSLVSPTDGFTSSDSFVQFYWNPSIGASSYKIEISLDKPFNNIIHSTFTQNTHYLWPSISQTGKYYWRIIALNPCLDSRLSRVYTFDYFKPHTVNSLNLWLIPDSADHISNSVTKWRNEKDTGISFTQIGINKQPKLVTNNIKLNGHSTIQFDGVNDYLSAGDTLDLSINSRSIFIVGFNRKVTSSFYFSKSILNNNPNRYGIFNTANELRLLYQDISKFNVSFHSVAGSHEIVTSTTDRLRRVNKLYKNSVFLDSISNFSGTNYNFDSPYYCLLGASTDSDNSNFTFYLDGSIAEIIMFEEALNDSTRELVERYLRFKYAPPVNLGADIYIKYGFCDTLLNASDRYLSYLWSTGEATPSILINKPGSYSVTVTDVFGQITTDTVNYIHPVNLLTDSSICLYDTLTYNTQLGGQPYQFDWNTGDTASSIKIYEEGNYILTVTDTNGCSITDSIYVNVDSFEILASLGPDSAMCKGEQLFLKVGAEDAEFYLWSTGETTSSILVDTPGTYWVRGLSYNNCLAYDTVIISVKGEIPLVDFTQNELCNGDTVLFTDLSIAATGDQLINWNWDFGDVSFSNMRNPSHLFPDSGLYQVNLRVETLKGCSNEITKPTFINPKPDIKFINTLPCHKADIQFTEVSSIFNGFSVEWLWRFGDSDISTFQNPVKKYDAPGNYQVFLQLKTNHGCVDSTFKNLTVLGSPIANFVHDTSCAGDFTKLFDSSDVSVSSPINNWQWRFGDSNFGSNQNPEHIYINPGQYFVRLTVTSTNGCFTDTTKSLNTYPTPDVKFEPDSVCIDVPFNFIDSTDDFGMGIESWLWNFGDGNGDTVQNPMYLYDEVRSYDVKLVVVTQVGCSDSLVKPIHVFPFPIADFKFVPEFGAAPIDIVLKNQSINAVAYEWYLIDTFGNETFIGNMQDPTITLLSNGKYDVKLIAFSKDGCSDTIVKDLFIDIPLLDLKINGLIINEIPINNGSFKVEVSARVVNVGTRKIFNFDLYGTHGNGSTIIETWQGEMRPGESFLYKFNSDFFIANSLEQTYICVEALNPNNEDDENPDDNRSCSPLAKQILVGEVFPNPADNMAQIIIVVPSEDQMMLELYNNLGQKSAEVFNGNATKGYNEYEIDLSKLLPGQYYLRVTYKNERFNRRLLIQH